MINSIFVDKCYLLHSVSFLKAQEYSFFADGQTSKPDEPLWKFAIYDEFTDSYQIRLYPLADKLIGGNGELDFSYANFARLRNMILTGLCSFGLAFPIAWTLCSYLLENRLGGDIPDPQLLQKHMTGVIQNLSIQTFLPQQNKQSPMIGLVPTTSKSILWWVSVLCTTFFIIYIWITGIFMFQSNSACKIPNKLIAFTQWNYLFLLFLFPAITWFINRSFHLEQVANVRNLPFGSWWGNHSLFVFSLCSCFIVFIHFYVSWSSCMLSIWVLLFALLFVIGLSLCIYLGNDILNFILEKVAFLLGVEIGPDSFFMRYGWIIAIGIPIYVIASISLPLLFVQNTGTICGF